MRLEFAPMLSDRETQFLDRLATLGSLDIVTFRRLERMLVETGERLVALVLKLGLLSEQRLLTELAALSGVDVLHASHLPDKAIVVPGLNLALLRAREVVPIAVDSRFVYVACWDPFDTYVERALRFTTGLAPRFVLATREQILDLLERLYPEPFGMDMPTAHSTRRWT